jgi:hypothetical protein
MESSVTEIVLLALSTANLYSAVQPGGSLFGLQESNPVDVSAGYESGDAARPDNIVYDIIPNPNGGTGVSAGGFGHPTCISTGNQLTLPPVQP